MGSLGGGVGLKRKRGLINFMLLKVGGGLLEGGAYLRKGGGLIED